MKQKNFLKIAFCFLLMYNISYGQITTTYDFSSIGADPGTNLPSPGISLDSNIGFGSFQNSSGAAPSVSSGKLKLAHHGTKGGSIIIYASNGASITDIVFNASNKTGPAGYIVDGGAQVNLTGGSTYK